MKVLFVLTSHSKLGDTGEKTGFWVEEFAGPYYELSDAGVDITIASPEGGQPPIDPMSKQPDYQTEDTKRYFNDDALLEKVAHTTKLSDISASDFDAVFYPGGHGPMWDLHDDRTSIQLIENFWKAGKPVAAVCHAPAALLKVQNEKGEPLVKGKKVTGFSNSEEKAVELVDVVPFLLEDELKQKGGNYSKGNDWEPYVVTDGMLITGQNPASSKKAAKELLTMMKNKSADTFATADSNN